MKKLLSTLTVVVLMLVIVIGVSADEKEDALEKAIEADETFQKLESLGYSVPEDVDEDMYIMAIEAVAAGQTLVAAYHYLDVYWNEITDYELMNMLPELDEMVGIIVINGELSEWFAWSEKDYEAVSIISQVDELVLSVIQDIKTVLDKIISGGSLESPCGCITSA